MYQLDKALTDAVLNQFEKCRKAADHITNNPEISGEEKQSSKYLVDFLESEGYEVQAPYAAMPYSFLAIDKRRLNENCKKALFLCEYDALPELGHACGHSISCGASLLAALALRQAYADLPIRMDIMGTPGEEFVGGKILMANNNAFDGYEFAAMVHMYDKNCPSFNVLASNDMYITFSGRASHASASPEEGVNALNAARLFMDAIDMWRQHITSDCQIHGIIEKGGELPNIVPEKVVLNYYFRAGSVKKLAHLNEIAEKCMKGAAIATDAHFVYEQKYPTYGELFLNDYKRDIINDVFSAMGLESEELKKPGGSTDAGNVEAIIPVFHPLLGITGGKAIDLHTADFEKLMHQPLGFEGLKNGGILLASMVLRLANEKGVLRKIQEDAENYRLRL